MPTYTQENRLMAIATPLGDDALLLTGLSGEEGASRLFRLDFELARDMGKVEDEIAGGENVIIDTSKMSPADIQSLQSEVGAKGLQNNVVWYP
jgi:hypothetical protein